MAPLVLLGTLLTHLVGGSAGREGTAVQMGASLAETLGRALGQRLERLLPRGRRHLLIAGMAGGFGSVFGTPWAGALFGLEVLTVGELALSSLLPATAASFVGDAITRALGVRHGSYPSPEAWSLEPSVLLGCALLALALGLCARLYVHSVDALKALSGRLLPALRWRLFAGGCVLLGVVHLLGRSTSEPYLGLGLPLLARAFEDPSLPPEAFALKLGFTALTLGWGFVGGEVTPLFVAGACLGSALAAPLHLPLAMGAGLGMGGLFAAASNAPLALALMTAELLGLRALPQALLVCALAFLVSGKRGIYASQRVRPSTREGLRLS